MEHIKRKQQSNKAFGMFFRLGCSRMFRRYCTSETSHINCRQSLAHGQGASQSAS